MPTFELQHTRLPGFAKTWPDDVARIISDRLESEIDAGDVRTIVLSIVRGTQRVGVWLNLEWDNYPDAEDRASAVGFLSLAPWLDQVDAVSRGELKLPAPTGWAPHVPLHFEDPAKDGAFKACWLELHPPAPAGVHRARDGRRRRAAPPLRRRAVPHSVQRRAHQGRDGRPR